MVSRLSAFLVQFFFAFWVITAARADASVNLADNFDDSTTDLTKWTVGTMSLFEGASLTDLSILVTEEDSHLKIAPIGGSVDLHYNGYVSKDKYDFFNGRFTVEIVEIPNPSSTGEMFLSIGADGNNFGRFEIHMGQLRADFKTNGVTLYYPLGQYSSISQKFLRIRHDPLQNLILWEASPDRAQWTTLHTESPGFPVANVRVELFAGTYTSAFSPGVAVFDNVELSQVSVPTNQPPQIVAQPQPKTVPVGQSATFSVEAFSLDPITYQWYFNSFFIQGATSAVFTIGNVRPKNVGQYRAAASNKFGLAISGPAELTLPAGDSEPPSIVVTYPPSGEVLEDRITIEGTATDNLGVTNMYLERENGERLAISLNDGAFSLRNVPLQLGTNNLRVVAFDAVGNQSFASLTLVLGLNRAIFIGEVQPVQEGALLNVPILLTSKGDVAALTFDLSYETAFLTLSGIRFSPAISGFTQANTQNVGQARLAFAMPGSVLPAGTQNVAIATFRARSVPQTLDSPLNLQLVGIYLPSGKPISGGSEARSGTARISQRKFIADNNANDLLDVGDASIIMRLVSGIDPIRSWDITANDLNQNQMVDAGDVIRVLRAAVNLDPQPTRSTQSALAIRATANSPAKVTLTSDKTNLTPGDRITVTLSLDNASSALSGSSFKIVYPPAALRLESAESHRPGALVPLDAMALWNLSPSQNDYAKQDGTLYAAFSSPAPWPAHAGELSVFTFLVQPGAANQFSWPVQASDIVLSDGFDIENPALASIVLRGQPTGALSPLIVTQPKNVTNVVEGDTATFTVVAEGTAPLEYQWLKESQPITGETAATLTLPNLALGKNTEGRYQAVVRNSFGSATSTPALLIIWPKAPPIISGSVGPREVNRGEPVFLLVTAVSVSPVTYQWLKDGAPIPGATETSFSITAAQLEDAGDYSLSISNPYGTTVSSPITVTVLTSQLPPPDPRDIFPVIESEQGRYIVFPRGEPLTLSVRLLRGTPPLQYQWYKNYGEIKGATASALTIPNADFADTAAYRVTVQNSVGSMSEDYEVTILDKPTIVVQPVAQLNLLPYLPSSLSARIMTGYDPLKTSEPWSAGPANLYWYRNGKLVYPDWAWYTTQYEASLTVSSANNPDSRGPGDYVLVISNAVAAVTSIVAHVEVKIPAPSRPPISSTPDLKRDLVAYWPFDDADGNKIRDHFGHHDLELASDATFLPGYLGNALHLAEWGTSVATYRATGPEDELPINRQPAFTISFWDNFYPKTYAGDPPYYFFEGDSENPNTRFAIAEENKNPNSVDLSALFRFVQPSKENVELHTEVRTFGVQEWRHVVFVQDEDGSRWLYIDGIEIPVSIPPRPAGESKVNYTQIGGSQHPPNTLSALFICCFPGVYLVDETAVWKRALTPEEIRLLHTGGISGPEPKPLAIQSLALDDARKTVTVNWNAVGDGLYSLLKSSSLGGPWTTVTNGHPSAVNDSSAINSFTDLVTPDASVFYQIRRE